ncbi:hypothetical protein PGT21_015470 [Puccinia graminis f. sp. tritici]|uniref:Uncharacterized protein n=1 Tax=Puccinia graminis f. sp. tritici TaxID=56615 RepID=A0A5B0R1D4_PUCGR|nr:hypothetical protein PGT21_015470 [Puccinia graminis f. sp. tritici]
MMQEVEEIRGGWVGPYLIAIQSSGQFGKSRQLLLVCRPTRGTSKAGHHPAWSFTGDRAVHA